MSALVVTQRQTITPERIMGRMNASYRFVVWGTIAAGALLGEILGSTLGLRPTLVIGVLGIAAAPAWTILSPIGGLRTAAEASAPGQDGTRSPSPHPGENGAPAPGPAGRRVKRPGTGEQR